MRPQEVSSTGKSSQRQGGSGPNTEISFHRPRKFILKDFRGRKKFKFLFVPKLMISYDTSILLYFFDPFFIDFKLFSIIFDR